MNSSNFQEILHVSSQRFIAMWGKNLYWGKREKSYNTKKQGTKEQIKTPDLDVRSQHSEHWNTQCSRLKRHCFYCAMFYVLKINWQLYVGSTPKAFCSNPSVSLRRTSIHCLCHCPYLGQMEQVAITSWKAGELMSHASYQNPMAFNNHRKQSYSIPITYPGSSLGMVRFHKTTEMVRMSACLVTSWLTHSACTKDNNTHYIIRVYVSIGTQWVSTKRVRHRS